MRKNHKWLLVAAWIIGVTLVVAAGIGISAEFAFFSKLDPNRVGVWFSGITAFATLLAAVGILAAFGQVKEAKRALRDNRAWNRTSAAVTFMPAPDLLYRWEIELEASFVKLISRNDPLTDPEVTMLFNHAHSATRILLKSYLNVLESYALAVNSGLADAEVAERFWGFKMVRHFKELKPYIDRSRHLANNQGIYGELETICKQWSEVVDKNKKVYPAEP